MRKVIYLLLALPLFIASCSNDPEVVAPENLTVTLPSDNLIFTAEGGVGAIGYTIANAPEDAKVEVTCDADWVENIKVSSNIVFSVLPNDDADRSTQMVISYKDQSFTVDIKQEGRVYAHDITFNTAIRIPVVGSLPDHYCYITLSDDSHDSLAKLMLVGQEGDIVLNAGTYCDSLANIESSLNVLYLDEATELPLESCEATIDVDGDVNGYNIDAKFVDAEGKRYRLRFSGVVKDMADAYNHLTSEPATLEAGFIDGINYALKYSPTYNYTIYISDLGTVDGAFVGNGKYYMLDLYGVVPEFDDEGYLIIPPGTYTFDPESSAYEMSIASYYSAYFVINEARTGYYAYGSYDDATLVVTEDGMTLDATILGAKHTVTYNGTPKFYVGVKEDRTFDATLLLGDYYGTQYSDSYNYNLWLTDLGFDGGSAIPGGTYYSIDLYGLEPEIDAEGYLHVPHGTYAFDPTGTCPEWSVGASYSVYYIFNEDGSTQDSGSFEAMTVVVSESGVSVEAYSGGARHIVTYEGEPKFLVQ